jgi:hypothetical protein
MKISIYSLSNLVFLLKNMVKIEILTVFYLGVIGT